MKNLILNPEKKSKILNGTSKRISTPVGIFIITLAVIIAGTGIFAYQYWWMPNEEIKTPNETADWETYRNEEYGFEFKYPSGWENPSESLRVTIFELHLRETQASPFLEYYPPNSKITFNNFIEGPWGHSSEDVPEEIIIDGRKAMKFSYITLRTGKGKYEPRHHEQVGLQDEKGGFFVINFAILLEKKEHGISLFNQMLSTFKFIETEDETADWKIYNSEELDIGFKYPSEWKKPVIKEGSQGKCKYQEIRLGEGGKIYIRSKTESEFLCFEPEPYFECGKYYFECSPSLTVFDCEPYKNELGDYDVMKILNDLKDQGFDCGTGSGRPLPPYIYNPELLNNQFNILKKASEAEFLDKDLKKEIESDFILSRVGSFAAGSDNKFYIDLIYNSDIDTQGIKIIGYEGSDVDAQNYYYRAIFLKDNKIIFANFYLFYDEILEWANNEMMNMGREGKSFDDVIIEAVKNKEEKSPIYEIVQKYDLLVKSIRFLETEKPYIKILSPNRGEKLDIGETFDILWEAFGVEKVNIFLRDCSVSPCKSTAIASFDKSALKGKYSWKITTYGPGNKYQIEIRDKESPEIKDQSDNYFSIVPSDNLVELEGKLVIKAEGTRSESWAIEAEKGPAEYVGETIGLCMVPAELKLFRGKQVSVSIEPRVTCFSLCCEKMGRILEWKPLEKSITF